MEKLSPSVRVPGDKSLELAPEKAVVVKGREDLRIALERDQGLEVIKDRIAGSVAVLAEDPMEKLKNPMNPQQAMALLVALGATAQGCSWEQVGSYSCVGVTGIIVMLGMVVFVVKYGRPALEAMLRATGGMYVPPGHLALRERRFSRAANRLDNLDVMEGPGWFWFIRYGLTQIRPGASDEEQIVKPEIDTLPPEGDFEEIQPINGISAKLTWSVTRELRDLRLSYRNMGRNANAATIEQRFSSLARDATLKAITNLIATRYAGWTIEDLNRHIREINQELAAPATFAPELEQFENEYGWRLRIQLAAFENDPNVQRRWDEARATSADVLRAQNAAQARVVEAQGRAEAAVIQADAAATVGARLGPDGAAMAYIASVDPAVAGPLATAYGYGIAGQGFGRGFGEAVRGAVTAFRQVPPAGSGQAPQRGPLPPLPRQPGPQRPVVAAPPVQPAPVSSTPPTVIDDDDPTNPNMPIPGTTS